MAVPDFNKDILFDTVGLKRLKDSYMLQNETSPQQRFVKVCNYFSSGQEHAKRLYEYVSKHWLSLSTPLLSFDESKKNSYPISCYLTYLDDTIESILETLTEVNFLSVSGGGVSVKVNLRSASEKSVGSIAHIKTYDSCVLAYKQGTRRGSYAVYMNIDHPEIVQFIQLRKPTGDYNMRALNIHHCVNLSDKFMELIENCTKNNMVNDDWELIDPHTKKVTEVLSARKLWEYIIETRIETGEPYLCFIDTCNKYMNKYQKKQGLKINQSNLCTEVIVPTNKDRSSLCCLASLNLEYYDEWKDNSLMVKDVMEMLDNVLNVFIEKSKNIVYFKRVLESAKKERNIGIGVMGFHAWLQKNNISIESEEARKINLEIFEWMNENTKKFNAILGKERGSPSDIEESNLRFAYTMAIAPTASTSIIMGNTSPSIEPYKANIYRQDTVSGADFNKNKFLEKLFIDKGYGDNLRKKIWNHIIMNNGSVMNLPKYILNDEEKNIFKTFLEIDQMKLVNLAIDRQKFIDQGQSLSLCFSPDTEVKVIHDIILHAWKGGLKTIYYHRSEKIAHADKLSYTDKFAACEYCES